MGEPAARSIGISHDEQMGGAIREPAAAGRLYPEEPAVLAGMIDGLTGLAPITDAAEPAAAYVVPHAAYQLAGRTASYVYARLRAVARKVRRVVLIGPTHFDPLLGCAVPATETWLTPLGKVAIDLDGSAALADVTSVRVDDTPHRREHALENQLPFLQRCLGDGYTVLPILVGQTETEEVVGVIEAAVAHSPAGTVVLCSTDLSQYLDPAEALVRDAQTVQAILALAAGAIDQQTVCGSYALRGLIGWARKQRLAPNLLHLSTVPTGRSDRAAGFTAMEFLAERDGSA